MPKLFEHTFHTHRETDMNLSTTLHIDMAPLDSRLDQAGQPLLHAGACHDPGDRVGSSIQLAGHEAVPT
jgi:hypothetical protein